MPSEIKPKESWIADGIDDTAVDKLVIWGKELADGRLTKTQVRNLFSEVKRIRAKLDIEEGKYAKVAKEVALLRPKIAYNKKRHKDQGMQDFCDFMTASLNIVKKGVQPDQKAIRYRNFVDLLEALLAFHYANS